MTGLIWGVAPNPAKTFFGNLLTSFGANLPPANIAKGFGIQKTLNAIFLLKFFDPSFLLRKFGGVRGGALQMSSSCFETVGVGGGERIATLVVGVSRVALDPYEGDLVTGEFG